MKSYGYQTETFYALVTDASVRLIFYTEESATDYLRKRKENWPGTHIQKVYSEPRKVEIE
jgi:hypothetical protein